MHPRIRNIAEMYGSEKNVTALVALTCPVCGAPFDRLDNRCGYCGVLVVIKSDHHRIDASQLNRSVINEHIQQYRQALRKDQNDEVARYGLGVAYFNIGLKEEALTELTEAARLMPENPFLQAQLGVVLSELGREGRPEYTFRAKERCDRALMLDPVNGDALALRQDLIKQDLYSSATPESREALERQLVDTWRRLASSDPERARPLLVAFLRKNTDTLSTLARWKAKPIERVRPKPNGKSLGRIGRALLWAAGSLVLAVVLTGIFAVLAPEKADGSVDSGSFFGVLSILSVLAIFVAPIVVFIFAYRRGKFVPQQPREEAPAEQPQAPYEALFDSAAPVNDLLDATEEVARSGWERAAIKRV